MLRPRLIALMLAVATLLVYLPATRHGFMICDDDDYVTNNPMVQQGLTPAGLKWAFTTFHAANWHPLTWLSLMADCQFFGVNAAADHFVNILLHAASAAVLFLLLWRLTGWLPPALLVAALFAWHPLRVESVAWVAERKDVLSTFFGLLALLSYVKFAKENVRRSFWLALVFFALSLLAKPMLVTLPFVLLLLDFWPLQRLSLNAIRWPLVWEKIPFLALAAGSCVVTYVAQNSGQAVVALDQLPLHYRLENVCVALMRYVMKILWPTDLAFIYPYGPIPPGRFMLAIVALVLISAAVWRARGRDRSWLTGWLWFLGTLVPVIGLVQVGAAAMADRYSYVPSIGIFIAVAFGVYALPWGRRIFPYVAALPLIACVLVTERQLGYWRDSDTLFRHTAEVTPNNEIAHYVLGVALSREGRNADALAEFHEALRINPTHFQVHYLTGGVLAKMNRPAEALAEFRECLRHDPGRALLHNAAAGVLAAQGNLAAALPEFAEAERLNPHYAQPHLDLAKAYFLQGQDDRATAELWAAVRAQPEDLQTLVTAAHYLAANTNAAARDAHGALIVALQAKGLFGQQAEVLDVLGMAFAAAGDFEYAVASARAALAGGQPTKPEVSSPRQARLELYQQHLPWLESFHDTNAPPL